MKFWKELSRDLNNLKTNKMAKLWKITAKRDNGKVVKGMCVEIAISDRSGESRATEIANAIQMKYNIEVNEGKCSSSYF